MSKQIVDLESWCSIPRGKLGACHLPYDVSWRLVMPDKARPLDARSTWIGTILELAKWQKYHTITDPRNPDPYKQRAERSMMHPMKSGLASTPNPEPETTKLTLHFSGPRIVEQLPGSATQQSSGSRIWPSGKRGSRRLAVGVMCLTRCIRVSRLECRGVLKDRNKPGFRQEHTCHA